MKIKFYLIENAYSYEFKPTQSDRIKIYTHILNFNQNRRWTDIFFYPSVAIYKKRSSKKVRFLSHSVSSQFVERECTLTGAKGYAKKFLKSQFEKLGIEVDID